jgi:RNA recognition motif-containing protein
MNIYVGNLSYDTTDEEIREAFGAHGEVTSARIIKDNHSGQSKGFGFVEMVEQVDGQAAISALDGMDFKGRSLNVNVARPKSTRSSSQGRF